LWFKNRGLNRFQLESSDIVSFHHYEPLAKTERYVAALKEHARPLICTEYLARTMDNHFRTHLPFFARERIGCTNWGLVIGKTQTAFSWQDRPGGAEPAVWFHDVLRADGSPYDPEEVELIRRLTAEHRG